MNSETPQRTVIYKIGMTDSARWDHFVGRDGDVFVCTPPKSGTTWMQTLCALLLVGWEDFDISPSAASPWYDAIFATVEEVNAVLAEQSHRRFIKTHTPLDGIPYGAAHTYVVVHRDPRDVFFSLRNHSENFMQEANVHILGDDIDDAFRRWLDPPVNEDGTPKYSLQSVIHHYRTFRQFEHLPNIHLFHYAEMKRDPAYSISRLAAILNVAIEDSDLQTIQQISNFGNMRNNADQFAPHAHHGLWKNNKQFFATGDSAQWRDILSEESLNLYDSRVEAALTPTEISWLNDGRR